MEICSFSYFFNFEKCPKHVQIILMLLCYYVAYVAYVVYGRFLLVPGSVCPGRNYRPPSYALALLVLGR